MTPPVAQPGPSPGLSASEPQAAAPVAGQDAQTRIGALIVELMMKDGVAPNVIAAALVANLTLAICSASPSVAAANSGLNAAASMIRANKRLVPALQARAASARHVASTLPVDRRQ